MQQVPVGGWGQELGVHVPPVVQMDDAAQVICVTKVQPPVRGAQQRPSCGWGQGLVGVQDAPAVQTVSAAVHWNWAFWVQEPVPLLQHVPVGGTKQGLGVQVPAPVQMLGEGQLIWMVMEQTPSWVQQLPEGGCGQGLVGEQVWPMVHVVLAPMHWIWKFCTHEPVVEVQHVPEGGVGQTLGEQLASAVQTFAAAQLAWLVRKQAPMLEQQLPWGGRQGLGGPHTRPTVQTFGAVQNVWKSTTHPPSAVQQVPVAGQGLGVQTAPAMNKLGNEQAPAVPGAQVLSVAQHAPVWARQVLAPASTPRSAASTRGRKRALDRSMVVLGECGLQMIWTTQRWAGEAESSVDCNRTRDEPIFDHRRSRMPK